MGALACRVELNKRGGVTITVRGPDGKAVQTVKLDGKAITLTCEDGSATSTIVQEPDGVTVKCKKFLVDAETFTLRSSQDGALQAGGKLAAKSTGDLQLESQAAITGKATSELALSAATLKAEARLATTVRGGATKVEGMQSVEIVAPLVKLAADGSAQLSAGGSVKVASDGLLDLTGTLTTLSGQMTNVKGTVVKLG